MVSNNHSNVVFVAKGVQITDPENTRATGKVAVETTKGIFEAEAVLVTVPLGVLKSGSIEFTPSLPQTKLNSIDKLGMGLLNKVVMKFPKLFWPPEVDFLSFIPDEGEELYNFISLYPSHQSPTLIGFFTWQFARELEKMSDKEITEMIMDYLRRYLTDIPDPTAVLVTRWQSDPFAFGSYSYLSKDATVADQIELARPLGNLFFAGEATSRYHFSTVHGAHTSGLREADQIANLFFSQRDGSSSVAGA